MLSQDLIDWLRLVLIPEIGSRRGKRLLERFKTPRAILKASLDTIAEVENIGLIVAERIVEARERIDIGRHIKLIEKNNVTLIPLDSESYPVSLKSTFDPPLVLFIKGEILPQDYFSIAIVGTRLASFYGRSMSEKLSRELAEKGFTIVSGGARGIDTFSHQAALRAKGRTIAVLGSGLDIAYPSENKKLFEEIAEKGAVLSEFSLGTRPDKQNFPMRNRIISGLSLGVVVIEAPHKSGALITVTHAAEQGREVFSVPGKADSFVSRGTNQLLRDGAKLVENADDIIEELEPLLKSKIKELKTIQPEAQQKKQILIEPHLSKGIGLPIQQDGLSYPNRKGPIPFNPERVDPPIHLKEGSNPTGIALPIPFKEGAKGRVLSRKDRPSYSFKGRVLSEEEAKVYNLLSSGPLDFDDILVKSQLPVGAASALLITLELKKLVKQLPGKHFIRSVNGK